MSRIYSTCKEAINEIERDIMEMGILVHPHTMQNKNVKDNEDYSTLEIQNYSFSILDTSDKDLIVGQDLAWCHAEFKERVSTSYINPGEAWKLRENVWTEFLSLGVFDYTYNERINEGSQLKLVIQELKRNPDTRQACIMVHFPEDKCDMQKKRIPCTLFYHLMIRSGKLNIIYGMRSSDFDTHFKNDIWLADELRKYIAKEVNVPVGIFSMNVSSLHRYKNYTKKHVF